MGDLNKVKTDRPIGHPPKWADRFFEWYCKDDLQEEIQGDLHEQFYDMLESGNRRKARLWYYLNVLLFFNRHTLSQKRSYFTRLNTLDMFLNYLKIGFRNIWKNKLSAFINAFGLSLAVGCCLVAYQFFSWFHHNDNIHQNLEEIYVTERMVNADGNRLLYGNIPEPLGPALVNDFPQIKNMVRYDHSGGIFQYEDQVFNEWITFTDPSFFELFDFPVMAGDKNTFFTPDAIIVNEHIAKKYFGDEDPIGKEVSIRFQVGDTEQTESFIVKGVMEEVPGSSTFFFNILIPYDRQLGLFTDKFTDWSRHSSTLFLQLASSEDAVNIQQQASKFLAPYNQANDGWDTESLHLQPLAGILYHSYKVRNTTFNSTHIAAVIMLLMIVVALMTLVCFNYMNIAVASASTRLKEIGVRKVMGGNRMQLIFQFLSENLIICTIAVLLGLLLAQVVFLPWFNRIADFDSELHISHNAQLWLFLLGLILLASVGGAGYPAFYLSSFQPVEVLKNKLKFGGKNRFRRVLLGGQFLLSFLAIFLAIIFMLNAKEANNKPWGYNQNDIVNIRLNHGGDFEQLKNELAQHPDIIEITGARRHVGAYSDATEVKMQGTEYTVRELSVGYNYVKTMELDLKNGRAFDENRPTDLEQSIIVNEKFAQQFGLQQVVGQKIEIDSQAYLVIGELKDFHHVPFEQAIEPMILRLTPPSSFQYLAARTRPGVAEATIEDIGRTWKEIHPDIPLNHYYQDAVFDNYFVAFVQVGKVLSATAFLTIIISAIGLFGLAMLMISRRMKELSIRKVLGANLVDISFHLNKEFLYTLLIASLLGIPTGYLLNKALMNVLFPDASMGIGAFVAAFICLLLMTVVSISKHIYMVAVSNPTRFLRDE